MKQLKTLLFLGAIGASFTTYSQKRPADKTDKTDKTVYYTLERNDPANSGLFGVGLLPAIVDINELNLNVAGGLELFYTFQSKFRVNAGYRFSYFDNPKGSGQDGEPYGTVESRGVPMNYKKASQINVQASYSIMSWEKEGKYHITLGSAGYRTIAVGRVQGLLVRALTARLGYQVDNRIIESENGIPFKTTTPVFTYNHEGQSYPLERTNLATSATMMQSNIISAGVAFTTFRDIKIDLDDDTYKGRREEKSQTDLFLDVLYAHKLQLQDMIYYHALYPFTDEDIHLPDRIDLGSTALTKAGIRIGYQTINMYKPHFGTKILIEGGLRPGPKGESIGTNGYAQLTIGLLFGGKATQE
jgi:hypothetical protein